ncbi:MAG: polymer-forming cytoskeletal protein [Clostridia bacterium]|nr:polymer-forming cytoskeletal protein [Clostridia bacterium]
MFLKKKDQEEINFEKLDTLIGLGTHFQGIISSQGTIRIDGTFHGEIKNQGDLIIGEKGILEANIEAKNVFIAGQIKGNILAKGKVEIAASGKVLGDLKVKNLVIEDGAIFKGTCLMDTPPKSDKSEPKPTLNPESAKQDKNLVL